MDIFNLKIKIALMICAEDGVISKIELDTLYKESSKIKKITKKSFQELVDEFFNESVIMEDYLQVITSYQDRESILNISKKAAASDGFDIRENLAYQKAKSFWEHHSAQSS